MDAEQIIALWYSVNSYFANSYAEADAACEFARELEEQGFLNNLLPVDFRDAPSPLRREILDLLSSDEIEEDFDSDED